MTDDQELKLQAFLDGELPDPDAREAAAWVARDPLAAELVRELRNTREALAGFEPEMKLPESREFYWSKIQREIQRQEPTPAPARPVSLLEWLRPWLLPTGAVAALLALVTVLGLQMGVLRPGAGPDSEMTVADAGAFTYRDYANGTTLVWLSYPAESEFAQTPGH